MIRREWLAGMLGTASFGFGCGLKMKVQVKLIPTGGIPDPATSHMDEVPPTVSVLEWRMHSIMKSNPWPG